MELAGDHGGVHDRAVSDAALLRLRGPRGKSPARPGRMAQRLGLADRMADTYGEGKKIYPALEKKRGPPGGNVYLLWLCFSFGRDDSLSGLGRTEGWRICIIRLYFFGFVDEFK